VGRRAGGTSRRGWGASDANALDVVKEANDADGGSHESGAPSASQGLKIKNKGGKEDTISASNKTRPSPTRDRRNNQLMLLAETERGKV